MNSLQDIQVRGKIVLVRVDLNVPIDLQGKVKDVSRVETIVPTVKHILGQGGVPVLMTHFGRPKGVVEQKFVLDPLVEILHEKLGCDVAYVRGFAPSDMKDGIVHARTSGGIVLLENLRFHPGEESNDAEFSAVLASLGDVYVNDAFSVSHRAHASVVGVPVLKQEVAMGLHFEKECNGISPFLTPMEHPVCFVLGGVKLETKIGVLSAFISKTDSFLFGGGLANTFLAAEGVDVGRSVADKDQGELVGSIMKKMQSAGVSVLLPNDVIVSSNFDEGDVSEKEVAHVESNEYILDIGRKSQQEYAEVISKAHIIIANGPMGKLYRKGCEGGMKAVIDAMVANTHAKTLIGGGDSLEALRMFDISWDHFTYVSTSGGAMLEFLEKGTLPGIDALEQHHA